MEVQVKKFLLRLGDSTSLIYYKDCLYLYGLRTLKNVMECERIMYVSYCMTMINKLTNSI